MRQEGMILEDDSFRVIRYLETEPMRIRSSNGDSLSHDVERYCAYRQDAYHEKEAEKDDNIRLLSSARESRLKLLDSIDKYAFFVYRYLSYARAITMVHLLTNTDWGVGVAPARFLSSRQSIPSRDRLASVGDKRIAGGFMMEIHSIRREVGLQQSSTQRMKNLVLSLRSSGVLVEMKLLDGGIKPVIDLLSSSVISAPKVLCYLNTVSGEPTIEFDPIMKYIVNQRFSLNVNGPSENVSESPESESVLEEILRANICALDYAILCRLQEETSSSITSEHKRLNRTSISKHVESLSVSYLLVSDISKDIRPIKITMCRNTVGRSPVAISKLREAYVRFSQEGSFKMALSEILLENL